MLQEFNLAPLLVVFAPAFLLGILHTAIPCEDKAIFFFWSFGISKTPKRSLFTLTLYGLGIMSSNMIIATGIIVVSFIPHIFFPEIIPEPYTINFFGAVISMFSGFILLFFILRRGYSPHSKQKDEIPQFNWDKKKTPYLFGNLAGFAPCTFELFIYSQCLQYSLGGGFGFINGIFTVLYFSIGSFIGLFPLALAKHGTTQIIKYKESKKIWLLIVMILIIIAFNLIIMILSLLKIPVFPEVKF